MRPQKNHLLPFILLGVSILIFSMANSVVAKLGELGADHLIDGRNPISFCNVLFTGNLIAGLVLFGIHHRKWNQENLSALKQKDWIHMTIATILLGVLAPTFFFMGLMLAEVINAILISMLDIPLTLLLAWIFFRHVPRAGTIIASLFAIAGILITFFLHTPHPLSDAMRLVMINIGNNPIAHFISTTPKTGEICIALATFFSVFGVEYSRKYLVKVPVEIYSVYRMIAGAIIFFFIVINMLGWVHFKDVLNPFVLEWMFVYGGIIVALGLYLWHYAIHKTSASDLAVVNSFQPIAGIFFAYLILREVPGTEQLVGGILILVGIGIGLAAKLRERKKKETPYEKRSRIFSGL